VIQHPDMPRDPMLYVSVAFPDGVSVCVPLGVRLSDGALLVCALGLWQILPANVGSAAAGADSARLVLLYCHCSFYTRHSVYLCLSALLFQACTLYWPTGNAVPKVEPIPVSYRSQSDATSHSDSCLHNLSSIKQTGAMMYGGPCLHA
jgi:hypothetical protein